MIHSEESRRKMVEAWERRRLIGVSASTRAKMSLARKGKKFSEDHKAKLSAALVGKNIWSKGRKMSEEQRLQLIQLKTGKPRKHIGPVRLSDEVRQQKRERFAGKNNPAWKHGRTSDLEFIRLLGRLDNQRRRALGKITVDEWETIKAAYKNTCPSCLRTEPEIKLTIDHIVPVSLGGKTEKENIQPLCGSCNSRKRNKVKRYDS